VARRLENPRRQIADLDHVAVADAQVDIGELCGPVMRGDDAAAIALLQLEDAADMIAMVMGDQDVG
jgi:hypothetical protein